MGADAAESDAGSRRFSARTGSAGFDSRVSVRVGRDAGAAAGVGRASRARLLSRTAAGSAGRPGAGVAAGVGAAAEGIVDSESGVSTASVSATAPPGTLAVAAAAGSAVGSLTAEVGAGSPGRSARYAPVPAAMTAASAIARNARTLEFMVIVPVRFPSKTRAC